MQLGHSSTRERYDGYRDRVPEPLSKAWTALNALLSRFWTPDYRFGQRHHMVARTRKAQSVLGAVLAVYASYRALDAGSASAWFNRGPTRWFNSMVLASAIFAGLLLAACGVLVAVAGPGRRFGMARLLRRPIGTLLASISTVALCIAGILGVPLLGEWATRNATKDSSAPMELVCLFGQLVGLVVMITLAVVVVRVLQLSAGYRFRAVDGHPTLPALLDLGMALWVGIVGVRTFLGAGDDPNFPWALNVGLLIVGPGVATALAIWELRRLNSHTGITFRWMPTAAVEWSTGPRPTGHQRRRGAWAVAAAAVLGIAGGTAAFALSDDEDGRSTVEATDPSRAPRVTEPTVSVADAPLASDATPSSSVASTATTPTTLSAAALSSTNTPESTTTIAPEPTASVMAEPATTVPHGAVIERRCVRNDIDFAAVREAPGVDRSETGRIPPPMCNVEVYATGSDGRIAWLQVGIGDLVGWSADSNFVPVGD